MPDITPYSTFEEVEPAHPGDLMKYWFMDGRGMSVTDVAVMTKLLPATIQGIIDGDVDITPDIASQLKIAFKESAETLLRGQAEYDYFKSHGEILPYDSLPKLG